MRKQYNFGYQTSTADAKLKVRVSATDDKLVYEKALLSAINALRREYYRITKKNNQGETIWSTLGKNQNIQRSSC